MKKILVANWKMNPVSKEEAMKLASACDTKNAIIAPPFPFLSAVGGVLKNASLGAQDVFWEQSGAYTGEVSVKMLKSLGVTHVIVGHSERRKFFSESNKIIGRKVFVSLEAGFKTILCVGEDEKTRKNGLSAVKAFVRAQIKLGTALLAGRRAKLIKNLIIAYEPVWAIGTGKPAFPEDAIYIANLVGAILKTKDIKPIIFLYGGSVDSKNIKYFLEKKEIDGALVGGASLNPKEFLGMTKVIEGL